MTEPDEDLERTYPAGIYDSAALDYARASERFWGFLSHRTVDQLALDPGTRVLDVACGPGVATIAAAERIGPTGRVIGLDSSRQMLAMTRERASDRSLENVDVELGDMARLEFEPSSFDAVVSVLGVFFVPDMPALIANLWSLVKPGGRLAITTLGEGAFDPAISVWKDEIRRERPDALLSFPWQRTETVEQVAGVFASAGVPGAEVRQESNTVDLPTADDWWLAVLGSGMRRTVLELDETSISRVRDGCVRRLAEEDIQHLQMPGIYALAVRR